LRTLSHVSLPDFGNIAEKEYLFVVQGFLFEREIEMEVSGEI